MRNQTLPKTVSLALAAFMMMLTLGAIDQLAANGAPAVQMAAHATEVTNATQTAKVVMPAQRATATPRS